MSFTKVAVISLISISLTLISSCYEPQGENFVKIEQPVLDNVTVNLAHSNEPLYIYQKTSFTYAIEDDGFQLVRVEGFLDGASLYDDKNPTEIKLDPAKFPDGNHKLRIEATFLTGSGSLGDNQGQ